MPFEFFDRKSEHVIRHGNLPHWYQPGVTYFVTFRTADSVPQALLRSWHARREAWLQQHGLDPRVDGWQASLRAMPDAEREYHETFTRSFMEYLDRGEGECPLKDPELARIVAENLRYGNGTRYHLGDFVVMPNHVHLLACLIGDVQIEAQCRSWKHYTATAIHRRLGKIKGDGSLFQSSVVPCSSTASRGRASSSASPFQHTPLPSPSALPHSARA